MLKHINQMPTKPLGYVAGRGKQGEQEPNDC